MNSETIIWIWWSVKIEKQVINSTKWESLSLSLSLTHSLTNSHSSSLSEAENLLSIIGLTSSLFGQCCSWVCSCVPSSKQTPKWKLRLTSSSSSPPSSSSVYSFGSGSASGNKPNSYVNALNGETIEKHDATSFVLYLHRWPTLPHPNQCKTIKTQKV